MPCIESEATGATDDTDCRSAKLGNAAMAMPVPTGFSIITTSGANPKGDSTRKVDSSRTGRNRACNNRNRDDGNNDDSTHSDDGNNDDSTLE